MALRGFRSRGTWLLADANESARPSKCNGLWVDGDTMVFNTKKGGGGEGQEKAGVHPSTLVPGGEGVALQIGMLGPCRFGVEGVEGGCVPPHIHTIFHRLSKATDTL